MSTQKRDTRTRILESTWKLLEAGTGNAVTMSDIAKAAGVSRQAVYLHFPKRAELLVATTRHLDQVLDVDARLEKSRTAETGIDRLAAFVEAWGNYIPDIHGVARALMAMKDTDDEAEAAWNDRMQAVRHGCAAAVKALKRDGELRKELTAEKATDLLWTLLSVRNWEQLRLECGWSQRQYIESMTVSARRLLTPVPD